MNTLLECDCCITIAFGKFRSGLKAALIYYFDEKTFSRLLAFTVSIDRIEPDLKF